MTISNFRYALGLGSLSAVAAALFGMAATAQAQTTTTAQLPILATYALTDSTNATFNAGNTSVVAVAPTTLATSLLQSSALTVPQAGPGTPPDSGLTRAAFNDDGYGTIFSAYPSNQTTASAPGGATTDAGAVAVGSYFTVNLTANTGSTFRVGRLSFDVGKGGATSDPRGYDVRSSVDNYSSSIDSTVLPTGIQPAPATDVIDLTNQAGYQNLSAITFRFYVYTANPSGRTVDFRNIVVSSQAAPEPGECALLLVGLAPMALVLRRRKRQAQVQA